MKAIYVDGKINYSEFYVEPSPKENEVAIKVLWAKVTKICDEFLEYYFVGEIVQSQREFMIGKKVFGRSLDSKILGNIIVCNRNNVRFVGENIRDQDALFILPISRILKILHTTHIGPTSEVAIIGSEEMAQLTNKIISYTGCHLMRVTSCLNEGVFILKNNLVMFVDDIKKISKFKVVIECTGSLQGIDIAKRIVEKTGTLILKNSYGEMKNINPVLWEVKNLIFLDEESDFIDGAMRLLENDKLKLNEIMGKYYSLNDYKKAFEENMSNTVFKL